MEQGKITYDWSPLEETISKLLVLSLVPQVLHLWEITLSLQILFASAWIYLGLMVLFLGYETVQTSSRNLKKYRELSIFIIFMLVLGISYLPEKFDWMDDLTFLLIMSVSVILFTVFWIGKIIPLEFFGNQEQGPQDWHIENASVKILYGSDLVGIVLIALNSWQASGYLSFIGLKLLMSILVAFFMFQFILRAVFLVGSVVDSKFQRDRLTIGDFIPFFTGTVIIFFYPLEEVAFATGVFSLTLIWITILFLRVHGSFESNKEKPELKLGVIILFLGVLG
ncbi:MAG: hypothetical protein D6732_16385 [Methanobacteriota archaeon]|nr:MAG: hypothetical protein D6732_16385 [Euryarchaeota archaeon]